MDVPSINMPKITSNTKQNSRNTVELILQLTTKSVMPFVRPE